MLIFFMDKIVHYKSAIHFIYRLTFGEIDQLFSSSVFVFKATGFCLLLAIASGRVDLSKLAKVARSQLVAVEDLITPRAVPLIA